MSPSNNPTKPKPRTNLPPNPYRNTPEENESRLNADIPTSDLLKLKAISPRHGTLQTIVSLYVKSLLLELDDAGVTTYSDESLVILRRIVLRHTHPKLVGPDSGPDDAGAKAGVHEPHPNLANKPADVKSKSGKGEQSEVKVGAKGRKSV